MIFRLQQHFKEVFPEREAENQALQKACKAFQALEFEEDAQLTETVYCDEDEYIYDEELGEEVPNPNYFEPYDQSYTENVIHNDNGFNNIFSAANDYLEEIFEIQSQLYCKQLAIEINRSREITPSLLHTIQDALPASAFRKPSLEPKNQNIDGKAIPSLDSQIKSAEMKQHIPREVDIRDLER